MNEKLPKIAFLSVMGWGGTEHVVINLLKELIKYPISIDLVIPERQDGLLEEVPPEVRIIELPNPNSRLKRIFPLRQYLRQEKPSVIVSHLTQYNMIVPIAKILSGIRIRSILVEHLGFSSIENALESNLGEKVALVRILRHLFYRQADVIAAVSKSLANELEIELKLKSGTINVLYNPIVDQSLFMKAKQEIDHPWLEPNQPPVFIGAGRLEFQKDFTTLIKAFAMFRQKYPAKLIILGEGSERQALEQMVAEMNLESDVFLPGFTDNPYAYMSKAKAFVLSSRFEGLPTVLIEALACGCQIVSTDCPHGPREILNFGEYGRLVPVGDVQALAKAMEKIVDDPINLDSLRLRAMDFSVEKSVSEYLKVMNLFKNSD